MPRVSNKRKVINWFLEGLKAEKEEKQTDALGKFLMEDLVGLGRQSIQSSSSSESSITSSSIISWVANDNEDFKRYAYKLVFDIYRIESQFQSLEFPTGLACEPMSHDGLSMPRLVLNSGPGLNCFAIKYMVL